MDGLFFVWAASSWFFPIAILPAVRCSFCSGLPVLQHRFRLPLVAVTGGKTPSPAQKAAASIRAATNNMFPINVFLQNPK